MDTYIIRIYRRRNGRPQQVVGVSEHVETGSRKSFQNMHQLNCILLNKDYEGTQPMEDAPSGKEG